MESSPELHCTPVTSPVRPPPLVGYWREEYAFQKGPGQTRPGRGHSVRLGLRGGEGRERQGGHSKLKLRGIRIDSKAPTMAMRAQVISGARRAITGGWQRLLGWLALPHCRGWAVGLTAPHWPLLHPNSSGPQVGYLRAKNDAHKN